MRPPDHGRDLRVLHSMAAPDGTTRYSDHMADSAPPSVHPLFFTWRTAFTARYDVFHAHWPEYLVRGRGRQRLVKPLVYLVFLLRLRVTRTPLVRTVHNATPHEPGGRVEKVLLALTDRWTDVFIRLNPTTTVPRPGAAAVTIPHGHYRAAFAQHPRAPRVPGRLLYFGLVKPYKGVDELVDVFAATAGDDLSLHVVGRTADTGTADRLRHATAGDPRITLDLRFVPDADLVREVTACELVVLPHTALENSGTALVALSLGRPVLVHGAPTTRALAAEVGAPWVQLLDGPLSGVALRRAWETVRCLDPDARPDLRDRDWDQVGRAHESAYRQALAVRRTP